MPYNGKFIEARQTQFGHKIVVANERGDWFLFGKGRMPDFEHGTEVEFEAQKSQNGNTWNYANLRPTGRPASDPRSPGQSTVREDGFRPNPDEQIFITGIVGRAMGSGQFSVTDIKGLTLAAYEAWQVLQQAKKQSQQAIESAPRHLQQYQPDREQGPTERRWKDQDDQEVPF